MEIMERGGWGCVQKENYEKQYAQRDSRVSEMSDKFHGPMGPMGLMGPMSWAVKLFLGMVQNMRRVCPKRKLKIMKSDILKRSPESRKSGFIVWSVCLGRAVQNEGKRCPKWFLLQRRLYWAVLSKMRVSDVQNEKNVNGEW